MPITEAGSSSGAQLRVLRALRNVTQKTLAKQTGIPASKIWQIENNFIEPTQEQLMKIWKALSTGE